MARIEVSLNATKLPLKVTPLSKWIATNGGGNSFFDFVPTDSQWEQYSVNLNAFAGESNVILKFEFLLNQSMSGKAQDCLNMNINLLKLIEIKNKVILEIGPGPGCLTRSLVDKGAKKIIVVEKDQRCIKALEYQKKYFLENYSLQNCFP